MAANRCRRRALYGQFVTAIRATSDAVFLRGGAGRVCCGNVLPGDSVANEAPGQIIIRLIRERQAARIVPPAHTLMPSQDLALTAQFYFPPLFLSLPAFVTHQLLLLIGLPGLSFDRAWQMRKCNHGYGCRLFLSGTPPHLSARTRAASGLRQPPTQYPLTEKTRPESASVVAEPVHPKHSPLRLAPSLARDLTVVHSTYRPLFLSRLSLHRLCAGRWGGSPHSPLRSCPGCRESDRSDFLLTANAVPGWLVACALSAQSVASVLERGYGTDRSFSCCGLLSFAFPSTFRFHAIHAHLFLLSYYYFFTPRLANSDGLAGLHDSHAHWSFRLVWYR